MSNEIDYGTAIKLGFEYLLENYQEVFVIGQGLWSPWYVGNSMTDLDKKFGKTRVIDTPVSESAVTGAGVGAAIAGSKPIVVHPRMDFMLYATDAVVNEAAKWSYMFGGQASAGVTIRSIINRGGEQGAQHSQALHSWFAHIPGLKVVMPYSVSDARDLLIAATLSSDPVLYIDDRWLYESRAELTLVSDVDLRDISPQILRSGSDLTIVSSGYSTKLAMEASDKLAVLGVSSEIIDLRILNPIKIESILNSVLKTSRFLVIDGGWSPAGIAGEIIAQVVEKNPINSLKAPPSRVTLPFAPAPAASNLEKLYYPTADDVVSAARKLLQ
jgi:pyruvate/2-oxoglutarate/acetoin dehydrogenase E1 component